VVSKRFRFAEHVMMLFAEYNDILIFYVINQMYHILLLLLLLLIIIIIIDLIELRIDK
jgi:hypothetical protein